MCLLDLETADTKRVNSFRLFWYHWIYLKGGALTAPEDTPELFTRGPCTVRLVVHLHLNFSPLLHIGTSWAPVRNHFI